MRRANPEGKERAFYACDPVKSTHFPTLPTKIFHRQKPSKINVVGTFHRDQRHSDAALWRNEPAKIKMSAADFKRLCTSAFNRVFPNKTLPSRPIYWLKHYFSDVFSPLLAKFIAKSNMGAPNDPRRPSDSQRPALLVQAGNRLKAYRDVRCSRRSPQKRSI
jgi:hypothetical protein